MLSNKAKYNIISSAVARVAGKAKWEQEKPYAHVYGDIKTRTGFIYLNRGHKNNVTNSID